MPREILVVKRIDPYSVTVFAVFDRKIGPLQHEYAMTTLGYKQDEKGSWDGILNSTSHEALLDGNPATVYLGEDGLFAVYTQQ